MSFRLAIERNGEVSTSPSWEAFYTNNN
jgi:hypothetical protein